jgi:thioredoxin 1
MEILKFEAEWCGSCKAFEPVLNEVKEQTGVSITHVNVDLDENAELVEKYGVMSIPRTVILKDGEVVDDFVGIRPAEYVIEQIK